MDATAEPHPPQDPFDPDYLRGLAREVMDPIVDYYFRPVLLGAEKIRREGPLILAPNHSGNAFPYDAMVLDALLWRRNDHRPEGKFRSVYERELALRWWLRPFGLDNFWRRGGAVDLTFDNFDRLLARGDRVIYYPEGVPGIGKGFAKRYQLQRFSTSFIVLGAKHRAPIYPVYVVNAEWVIPFNYTFRPVNALVNKLFNVPYLPLPGAVLALIFPWVWYMSLPARMVFRVGDPIDPRALLRDRGYENPLRTPRHVLREVAEQVRASMQPNLDRYVARYGRWPYQARLLAGRLREARRRGILWKVLPSGWPLSFIRYDRDLHRPPARSRWHAVARDWDVLGYYLPLGWLLLPWFRRWRRPPCGYRTLSPEERREREGAYIWHLAERPLPPRPRPGAPAGERTF